MRCVMLVDNGSSRAESTLALRRLAAALGGRLAVEVHPVSLLHSSKIPPAELDGRAADTFEPFLHRQLAAGIRKFLVLPLFFGPSRALSRYIPEKAAELRAESGPCDVRIADTLCPLPHGEPRLVEILRDNLSRTAEAHRVLPRRVVLVDHGSPIPAVTAVRRKLAAGLRAALGNAVTIGEAVMERRQGPAYDFNGVLLEDLLRGIGAREAPQTIILSMLFLLPGRHAGGGGDIERICHRIEGEFPGLRLFPTALVGPHPGIVEILRSRYEQGLRGP